MYTSIIRYALTLVFCTFAYGGWAQGDVIFEDHFNGLTIGNTLISNLPKWSGLQYCYGITVESSNTALKIERQSKDKKATKGYAITDPLDHSGDYFLSFKHAYTAKDEPTKARVILSAGAYFKENNSDYIDVDVNTKIGTMTEATLRMINVVNATTIQFTFEPNSIYYYAIDDVIVTKIPIITIDEEGTNSDVLEANTTKTVNTHRTLLGGIWNTLCLPFDVSMADLELALGENQDIQVRTFDSYDSKTKVMTFVNPFGGENSLSAISAGTPFLIKLNSDVENPTFHAVTISNTAAQSIGEEGPVHFVGTYSPVELAIDGTNIFITKDNTLALPAEGKNTMNGLRAYIVVPESFDSSGARLLMDDGETASVSDLAPSVETYSKATYSLNGQRVVFMLSTENSPLSSSLNHEKKVRKPRH